MGRRSGDTSGLRRWALPVSTVLAVGPDWDNQSATSSIRRSEKILKSVGGCWLARHL
jgi:hypothetical protein